MMDLETLAAVSPPLIFLAFMGFEPIAPSGRSTPQVRLWRLVGIVGLVAALAARLIHCSPESVFLDPGLCRDDLK